MRIPYCKGLSRTFAFIDKVDLTKGKSMTRENARETQDGQLQIVVRQTRFAPKHTIPREKYDYP